MAESNDDITVYGNIWVNLNTLSGIAVGTVMKITNKGDVPILLYEGTVQPNVGDTKGKILTTKRDNYAVINIGADSLDIWAISLRGTKIDGTVVVE